MATRDEILRFVVKTEGSESVRAMSKDIDAVTAAAAEGEPKAQALVDELDRLNEASGAVNSLGQLKARLSETGVALGAAKRSLDSLNAEFGETAPKTAVAAKALAKAEQEVAKLTRQENQLTAAVAKASGTIEKHGLDVKNLGAAQQVVAERTKAATQAVSSYASAATKASQSTDAVEKSAGRVGKAFQSVRDSVNSAVSSLLRVTGIAGAVSSALGAIGVGRLFGGAISSATEFEAKLSEIKAVTGASTEQLARMKKAAEDATKSTKFSAAEAADALGELARASGDADSAIAQLAPTLNLAQAAGISTSDAARILTTTLTQFGLAATDAARVADVFSKEANSTQDTVLNLGNAMSYTAPLAKQLGMTLEDTTAVLGALANAGFTNERAGTAFRFALSQLIDPASKFNDELRSLGIRSKNFAEIIPQLAAAGDKANGALLALGTEAGPAIRALVNGGTADIKRLQAALSEVAGESGKTAKTMGDNFAGATARLRNAFDQLQRDLVEPILEPLKVQFDEVAGRVREFIKTADFATIVASIKQFVLDGTSALIEFGKGVDYTVLAAKIREFAKDASGFFTSLKENVQSVLSAISIAGGTISTVFNGIQTVILGAATVAAGALSLFVRSIKSAVEAMTLLPGGAQAFAGVAERLTEVIGGLDSVAAEFAKRTKKNAEETAKAFEGLASSIEGAGAKADDAAPKIESVGTAAGKASGEITKYADELGIVPDYTAKAGETSASLAQTLERLPFVTNAAAAGFKGLKDELSDDQKLAAARLELQRTSSALGDLAAAGQQNAPAFAAAYQEWERAAQKLAELEAKARGAIVPADELAQAYKNLGVVSQAELASAATKAQEDFDKIRSSAGQTTEGINKTREAFVAYAKAQLAAVASSDAATKAQTESTLRQLAAQVQAIEQFDQLTKKQETSGKVAEDTGRKVVRAGETGARALDKVQDSAKSAEKEIKEAGKTAEAVTVSFAGIGKASFKAVADLYSLVLARKASVGELTIEIQRAQERLTLQQRQVDAMTASYNNLDDSAARAMATSAGGADQAADRLRLMAQQARAGVSAFDELDQSQLNNLAAAAEAAAARVAEITQRAREATQALNEIASSAQDEIDSIKGNEEAIEQRRFEKRIEQIRQEAEFAGAMGAEASRAAQAREEELHALRLQKIRIEQAERANANQQAQPSPNAPAPRPGNNGGGATGSGGVTNNFTFNGLVLTGTKDQVAEQLARLVGPPLSRIQGRGG